MTVYLAPNEKRKVVTEFERQRKRLKLTMGRACRITSVNAIDVQGWIETDREMRRSSAAKLMAATRAMEALAANKLPNDFRLIWLIERALSAMRREAGL